MTCVMCSEYYPEAELDFVGRCTKCFKKYLTMPEQDKPSLGIPFTPVSKAVK